MKFLLIGGAGYVGGRLAAYLKTRGHRVVVASRRPASELPGWLEADEVVELDLGPGDAVQSTAEADVVVHLAAPDRAQAAEAPAAAVQANVSAAWRVCEAVAEAAHPPALLYLSTFHVYGAASHGDVSEGVIPQPNHPYALGKRLAEEVVGYFRQRRQIPALTIRLANAMGYPAGAEITQWDLVFNDLARQAVEDGRLVLKSSGSQSRNFIALGDCARAVEFLAADRSRWPEDGLINLGSDISLTIREAADKVAERAGRVLGAKPPVIAPEAPPGESPRSFTFNIERLRGLGFEWRNAVDFEVDRTLELCSRMTAASSRKTAG